MFRKYKFSELYYRNSQENVNLINSDTVKNLKLLLAVRMLETATYLLNTAKSLKSSLALRAFELMNLLNTLKMKSLTNKTSYKFTINSFETAESLKSLLSEQTHKALNIKLL